MPSQISGQKLSWHIKLTLTRELVGSSWAGEMLPKPVLSGWSFQRVRDCMDFSYKWLTWPLEHHMKKRGKVNDIKEGVGEGCLSTCFIIKTQEFLLKPTTGTKWSLGEMSRTRTQAGLFLGPLLPISSCPFLFPEALLPLPLDPCANCNVSIIQVQLSHPNHTLFFLIPFPIPGGTWMKPTWVCYPLLVQSVMAGNWDNTWQNKKVPESHCCGWGRNRGFQHELGR